MTFLALLTGFVLLAAPVPAFDFTPFWKCGRAQRPRTEAGRALIFRRAGVGCYTFLVR